LESLGASQAAGNPTGPHRDAALRQHASGAVHPGCIAAVQADENERGIKRTGLIYSPRRSWWLGIGLIALSVCIFTITIVTAFYHP
jgi:hypothetical protein